MISGDKSKIDDALMINEKDFFTNTFKKMTWPQCDLADWKKTKEVADTISKS